MRYLIFEVLTIEVTKTQVLMSSTYGVAGTAPLADLTNTVNVLLKDAIAAVWNTDVTAPPAVTDMLFLTSWFTGRKDIELIFKSEFEDKPWWMGTVGQAYQGCIDTVNIHVGVRARSGDTQPVLLNATLNGLDKILRTRRRTLLPNMWQKVISIQPANDEKQDDKQTWYHRILKCQVYYYTVTTV